MAQNIHDRCVNDVLYSGALPVSEAGGIGIMASAETNKLKVLSVAPNTPAYNAGIKAGNLVLAVNGQTVENWSDARRLIFGRVGTQVTVTYSDGNTEKTATMTRAAVVASSSAMVGK